VQPHEPLLGLRIVLRIDGDNHDPARRDRSRAEKGTPMAMRADGTWLTGAHRDQRVVWK
jgi:hypothetical protein